MMTQKRAERNSDAKVLLFDEHGKVLVERTPDTSRGANQWTLPGGRVEPGEEPQSAAEHRLYKKSGIAATLKPNGLFDCVSDDDTATVYVFWGEYTGGREDCRPKVGEGWPMEFMRVSDMRDLNLTSVDRQILMHYL